MFEVFHPDGRSVERPVGLSDSPTGDVGDVYFLIGQVEDLASESGPSGSQPLTLNIPLTFS